MQYFLKIVSLSAALLFTSHAMAEKNRYDGLCEASAASIIADGLFAVASDDLDKLDGDKKDSLGIYKLGSSEPVAWTLDLGKLTDIEASASIKNVTFWITSHSLTKSGKDKDKRKKLFATEIIDGIPREVGGKYKDLRVDIANILNAVDPDITTDYLNSTLNIEGLASNEDGSLLVGLRAPLTEGHEAIVVNIGSPFEKLGINAPASTADIEASSATFLDLNGRGIRSMARLNGHSGYLIIAGASQKDETDFALYHWDGNDAVQEITFVDFQDIDPEAMIIWPDGKIQIFGDNGGSNCSDNPKDSNLNQPWFPSIFLDSTEVMSALNRETWSCRNTDLEIGCSEVACSASEGENFTPTEITFDENAINFCAYTECWKGSSTIIEDEKALYAYSHDLLGQNDQTRPPLTLQIALNKGKRCVGPVVDSLFAM